MGDDPGDDRHAELLAPVIDPSLPPAERAALEDRIVRAAAGQDMAAGCFGALVTAISALGLLTLHVGFGLNLWWLLLSAIPLTFGLIASRRQGDLLSDADLDHLVLPEELDKSSRKIQLRTQRAVEKILDSSVFIRHCLDPDVGESTLRHHEWEIATALREITRLRAELGASLKGDAPGPMTAAVLESHRRALELSADAIRSRVRELERYATELEKAEEAERDWQAATQAAGRNDAYLELVARTAADEHAIEEIRDMTEQAAQAAQALRDHLREAGLAGQALVLPPPDED
jgi:hypothetical protein